MPQNSEEKKENVTLFNSLGTMMNFRIEAPGDEKGGLKGLWQYWKIMFMGT